MRRGDFMKFAKLIKNSEVSVRFYAIKDEKGVLFYSSYGDQIGIPELNLAIDGFLLNRSAKVLICLSRCTLQFSEILVDYFPENDILDITNCNGMKYIVLG